MWHSEMLIFTTHRKINKSYTKTMNLTLLRIDFLRAAQRLGWVAKNPTSQKSVTHILQ